MKQEVAKIWVDALRSGKYVQGKRLMRKGETFCALGVLCDAVDPTGWGKDGFGTWNHYGRGTGLSLAFAQKLGVKPSPSDGFSISHPAIFGRAVCALNDDGKTFAELADLIEAHWEDI